MRARVITYGLAVLILVMISCGDETPSGTEAESRFLWRAPIGERVASSPKLGEGFVYAGGAGGYVYCLEEETGREEWRYQYSGDITSDPCVANGKVFFVSDESLFCLDAKDGRLLWTYRGTARIGCNPVTVDAKLVFFHYGIIDCVNANNGASLWKAYNKYEENFYGTPCIYQGKLYIADMEHFFCFNVETGKLIWESPLGDVYYPCSPCADDDKVFLPIQGYQTEVFDLLKCYDTTSGELLWTYNFGYHQGVSDPVTSDGKVYVARGGDDPRYTRCLDASSGKLLWESITGYSHGTQPCVGGGKVFIGNNERTVVCVDAGSGNRLWSYEIPRDSARSKPRGKPAYANGRLYVDTDGPYLYCIKAD